MKRILLTIAILLIAGTMVFAQQRNSQNQDEKQKYLDEAKANNSAFQDTIADLKDRNGYSGNSYKFDRLKNEIGRLESTINSESKSINSSLEKGSRVSSEVMNRLERSINQPTKKVEEMENLLSSKK